MRKNNLSVIFILCFSLLVFGCNKESNYIVEPEELKENTYAWKLDQYNDSATFNLLESKGWMLVTENHAGEHKMMEVVFDGVPLIFLFDTGCITSQIGPLGLRKIGLDADTVYSKTNYIIAKKATVGGVECENIDLVLSENYGYEELGYDGIIGMFFFHKSKIIGISYDENVVYANPQVPSTVEFFPVVSSPLNDVRFSVYVNIDDSNEKYIGLIDSGAATITLDNRTFGFNPDYASNDKIQTGSSGVANFKGKRLPSLKVNDLVLEQPKVWLTDYINDSLGGDEKIDVLLGGPDFWRGRTVYLDIKGRKVGW